MRRLLLLPLLLGILSPALADLGEAESDATQQKVFDAWCGKPKNSCKVTFDGKRLRVNDGEGITRDQILYTEKTFRNLFPTGYGWRYTFLVNYRKNDGTNGLGKFFFTHTRTSNNFTEQLSAFTGKPVGGTDPATAAAKQAADAQSKQQLMQGVQMLNKSLQMAQ